MTKKYDIHLSAFQIAPATVKKLEDLGFARDLFSNNTRCDTTAYHGTYRGTALLPSDPLWQELTEHLKGDQSFVGTLEQESYLLSDVKRMATEEGLRVPSVEPFRSGVPESSRFKECDIHINVALATTCPKTVLHLHSLGFASFDKPGPSGVHRVFSITCDNLALGKRLYEALLAYLGELPRLHVKTKFETTDRFLRFPSNAPCLPILGRLDLENWMKSLSNATTRAGVM